MNERIYGLYIDDKLMYKGTRQQLLKMFGISYRVSFWGYMQRGERFKRLYEVKLIEGVEPKSRKKFDNTDILDNNLLMIQREGNCYCSEINLEQCVQNLKAHGYEVSIKPSNIQGGAKGYILERI